MNEGVLKLKGLSARSAAEGKDGMLVRTSDLEIFGMLRIGT